MKNRNLNSKEVLDKVASELPGNMSAMLVIAADDSQHVRTFLFGGDHLGMSPNCVALAAAMHDLLDGQLGIADSIYQRFKDDGALKVQRQTTYHKDDEPQSKEAEQPVEDEQPNPADILHKMIDAIFCGSVGGDIDEDDD